MNRSPASPYSAVAGEDGPPEERGDAAVRVDSRIARLVHPNGTCMNMKCGNVIIYRQERVGALWVGGVTGGSFETLNHDLGPAVTNA